MVATFSMRSEDLETLSSQLNAIADGFCVYPYRHVGSIPGCGSASVADAASDSNEHAALRALLIEAELRDAAIAATHVAKEMAAQEDGLMGAMCLADGSITKGG